MNIKPNVISHTRITHDKFYTKNKTKWLPVGHFFFFFFELLLSTTKKYLLAREGGNMWVHFWPLSLSAQFVSVRSLRLYVPFISVLLSSASYRAGGQARDVASVGPPFTTLGQH